MLKRWLEILVAVTAGLVFTTLATAGWQCEGPWQGNIKCLAIDPGNPSTIYAGAHNGGIWKSIDDGASWVLSGLVGRVILSIHPHPGNPAKIWTVTEGGIYLSENSGGSWKYVSLGAIAKPVGNPLAIAPSNPKRLLLPDVNILYRSKDGGNTWAATRIGGGDVYGIAFDPKDSQTVYAALSGGPGGSFLRSSDGGATWDRIARGITDIPKSRRIHAGPAGKVYMVTWRGIYKSEDRGETWTPLGGHVAGAEVVQFSPDPKSPDTLYTIVKKKGLLKSIDGGISWSRIDRGFVYVPNAVVIHPVNPNLLFVGSYTGVKKSTDGGKKWHSANRGLAAAWVDRLAVSGQGTLYARIGKRFFRRDPTGAWHAPPRFLQKVKAEIVVVDPEHPDIAYLAGNGEFRKTTDNGVSWVDPYKKERSSAKSLFGRSKDDEKKSLRFPPAFHSLAQDPDNPDILFSGVHFVRDGIALVRSENGGVHWRASAKGLPDDKIVLLKAANAKSVYAVTGKSGVYRSSDSGHTWSSANLPDGKIRDLAIDPAETARVYLATEKGLFLSRDSCQTWSARNQGLASTDLRAVVVVPGHGLFVAGFKGVYHSRDQGNTWTNLNEGLINTDIRSLAISGGKKPRLYAGTAGGSVFSTALPR